MNYVDHNVFEYIEVCKNFDSAITTLDKLELRNLSKDCNLDAFITGIASPLIRQRPLENGTLDLHNAYKQAYSLDPAQSNADAYAHQTAHAAAVVNPQTLEEDHSSGITERSIPDDSSVPFKRSAVAATCTTIKKCFFCGGPYHVCNRCLAREATCNKCTNKGHFARVCKFRTPSGSMATAFSSTANIPQSLSHSTTSVTLNGGKVSVVMGSYSTDSYISERVAQELKLKVRPTSKGITVAQKSFNTSSPGYVILDLILNLNNQLHDLVH
ncbi:uncharacterized protein [Panulirus ornatus]|uniref:uncharacterized protein n=1 Tax=Panulirus ornatus TaxID=150431 RepID=UPI003A846637